MVFAADRLDRVSALSERGSWLLSGMLGVLKRRGVRFVCGRGVLLVEEVIVYG